MGRKFVVTVVFIVAAACVAMWRSTETSASSPPQPAEQVDTPVSGDSDPAVVQGSTSGGGAASPSHSKGTTKKSFLDHLKASGTYRDRSAEEDGHLHNQTCDHHVKLPPILQRRRFSADSVPALTTPLWTATKEDIADLCRAHGEPLRSQPVKLVYGVMVSSEVDILEVVLYEVYPAVDYIVIIESTTTHNKERKTPKLNQTISTRFRQFSDKILYDVFDTKRKVKSGWDIEKAQRTAALYKIHPLIAANVLTAPDLLVLNMDLDELLSRHALLRLKYCDHSSGVKGRPSDAPSPTAPLAMSIVHFRYHFNCLQSTTLTTYATVIMTVQDMHVRRAADKHFLYRARGKPTALDFTNGDPRALTTTLPDVLSKHLTAWHLSGFGGLDAVMFKYRNSPHASFTAKWTREEVAKDIAECRYNEKPSVPVPGAWWTVKVAKPGADKRRGAFPLLPYAVAANWCHFAELGWFM